MTDTPSAIAELLREKIMSRSGEERLRMASDMFEAARAIVNASLPPDLPASERCRLVFQRIYGFAPPTEMR